MAPLMVTSGTIDAPENTMYHRRNGAIRSALEKSKSISTKRKIRQDRGQLCRLSAAYACASGTHKLGASHAADEE